jgi:aarF domain-containing kinase
VLLLKDGRLGLIDYGQVKHLAVEERIKYAKLILAIARDDKSEICRVFYDEMGTKTKYMKLEIGYKMACFYNDRDTVDLCGDKNIAYFIDYLEAEDPMVQLPEAYIMAARVSIMLRGMGNAFGLKLRTSKLWEDEARQFLASQGIKA